MHINKSKVIPIFFLYLFLSVLFTFPLVFNLKDSLIGRPLDGYLYIWNIYNFWDQALNLQNPFYTYKIFFPIGFNLALNSSAPLVSLAAFPFVNNIPLYLNMLIILSFPLSAIFTFILIRRLTLNNFAGFTAGLIYGFSPILFSYIVSQHYYFAFASVFIPIGIIFVEDFLVDLKIKSLAKIISIFWVIFFIDYYISILYLIICIIYTATRSVLLNKLKELIKAHNLILFLKVIVIMVIAPLTFLYFLVFPHSNLKIFSDTENFYPPICSAKPSDFLVPAAINPFLGRFSDTLRLNLNSKESGDTPYLYLGIIPIILSLLMFTKPKAYKTSLPFLIFGSFMLLFSMGPKFLLFKYFARLPFMSFIDCPQRFTVGVQFSIASLVGIFYSLISSNSKLPQILPRIFLLVAFLLEYSISGITITKLSMPNVYKQLIYLDNSKTLLEIPSGLTESKGGYGYDWYLWGSNATQMYWQTIHKKNRVGGYVSRIPNTTYDYFKNAKIISDIFNFSSINGTWGGRKFTPTEADTFITNFNLGYILISPNPRADDFSKVIDEIFEGRIASKIFEDKYILYILSSVR